MLLVRGNTDIIRVNVTSAIDLEVFVSALQHDAATPALVSVPNFGPRASITGTGDTTIVDATGLTSGHGYNVIEMVLFNNHATDSSAIRVESNDGTNTTSLHECTLLAGEKLVYRDGEWLHYDANGLLKLSAVPAATQSDMEGAALNTVVATPGNLHWHPGVAKAWGKAAGAGTLTVNYNVSGVSDTATGRLGVTIGTDFSTANYSIVATLERSVTSLTATGVEDHGIRNASPAAGSFEIESYDQTAILFAAQDPASYFWACFGDQ